MTSVASVMSDARRSERRSARLPTKRVSAEVTGLAVPGMPIGSPGMEGGIPEAYEVVVFGPDGRRTYMRFLGERQI
jgi:hypothetical protein